MHIPGTKTAMEMLWIFDKASFRRKIRQAAMSEQINMLRTLAYLIIS